MKKIAVLISGQGNNLQAIIDACQTQQIPAEIVCVISNKANAFGLIRAQSAGVFSRVFLRNNFESNLAMDQSIADELDKFDVDLIVLAGYMKILTPEFIQRFEGKIINIHPSLLPKYPGLNTYQRALDSGDREHGTTVHFVNEEVDNGAIILQAKVPIFDNDTVEVIEARTREQEYRIYPIVVKWFVENRLKLQNGVAYLDNIPLPEQGYANN
ncbi:phosphoribosylglycinamide formyltransferase [Haemophilus haemolyticus]|uniref:phosphoribosylglycinamide formyltransferase n=1 Tax=Haemophilus haemolyticus TaxID=726 RepID=UPI00112CC17A|nr:phosphoribosylglycinamide formyltransferase [Haemophilus haemolyticus]TPH28022.1 phosphoribosylglycinamide formyltransferase [Haemophilus haemolyticus]